MPEQRRRPADCRLECPLQGVGNDLQSHLVTDGLGRHERVQQSGLAVLVERAAGRGEDTHESHRDHGKGFVVLDLRRLLDRQGTLSGQRRGKRRMFGEVPDQHVASRTRDALDVLGDELLGQAVEDTPQVVETLEDCRVPGGVCLPALDDVTAVGSVDAHGPSEVLAFGQGVADRGPQFGRGLTGDHEGVAVDAQFDALGCRPGLDQIAGRERDQERGNSVPYLSPVAAP